MSLKPNKNKKFFDYFKDKKLVEEICPIFKVERIITPLNERWKHLWISGNSHDPETLGKSLKLILV